MAVTAGPVQSTVGLAGLTVPLAGSAATAPKGRIEITRKAAVRVATRTRQRVIELLSRHAVFGGLAGSDGRHREALSLRLSFLKYKVSAKHAAGLLAS
jgi:hypothetical protein